ncbi:hypothetical protein DH2020_023561 [Rehmannia glutinosa]|uniref:Uncharacterized protein n=1 Tax=Rehmannia glutinosa TaxID=99300 RepID=A0ABR0W6D7_REHGL
MDFLAAKVEQKFEHLEESMNQKFSDLQTQLIELSSSHSIADSLSQMMLDFILQTIQPPSSVDAKKGDGIVDPPTASIKGKCTASSFILSQISPSLSADEKPELALQKSREEFSALDQRQEDIIHMLRDNYEATKFPVVAAKFPEEATKLVQEEEAEVKRLLVEEEEHKANLDEALNQEEEVV